MINVDEHPYILVKRNQIGKFDLVDHIETKLNWVINVMLSISLVVIGEFNIFVNSS